jgi:hypothetical protein
VLAGNHNSSGEAAMAGADNLYVLHHGGSGWSTSFVAVLSGADNPDWLGNAPFPALNFLTARVSPDGRWLAFMSQRSLTGYDNRDAVSGASDEEVFLYDAERERVVCASCDPTGARPHGVEARKLEGGLVEASGSWQGVNNASWLAGSVPGWTPYKLDTARYQPRYLSDGGRLFFNSSDALVPQDVNGTWDVYEFEPLGVGDCSSSSVGFSERSGGCVGLVSSGGSVEESAFVDASETGGDVFFLTAARLALRDYDTTFDVYDAHECTGVSPCFPEEKAVPPSCDTEASCKAAPSPQPSIFGAPSSATFSGAGNIVLSPSVIVKPRALTRAQKLAKALSVCKKKPKKKRSVCEKQARRVYGSVRNAKKSHKVGR